LTQTPLRPRPPFKASLPKRRRQRPFRYAPDRPSTATPVGSPEADPATVLPADGDDQPPTPIAPPGHPRLYASHDDRPSPAHCAPLPSASLAHASDPETATQRCLYPTTFDQRLFPLDTDVLQDVDSPPERSPLAGLSPDFTPPRDLTRRPSDGLSPPPNRLGEATPSLPRTPLDGEGDGDPDASALPGASPPEVLAKKTPPQPHTTAPSLLAPTFRPRFPARQNYIGAF